MDLVTNLLVSLGVNPTLWIQLGIFLVTFLILQFVLFKPYFAAFNERNERTLGQTELAERYITQTRELEEKFAAKASEVNEKYRAVFDQTRTEANKEFDTVIGGARARAKQLIDETRKKIQAEMESARTQLDKEVGTVSQLINSKMIGKEQ
jgi:F-type H+-transporting ATPase subunit b